MLWHSAFAQCSMLGSVFVGCRMRPITFDEVDFTLAVLGGNDLRGVDLSGCRLRETSLVETDLRKAVLRGTDLSGAGPPAPGSMTPTCAARPWTPRYGERRPWRVRASTSAKPWPLRWLTGCVWKEVWTPDRTSRSALEPGAPPHDGEVDHRQHDEHPHVEHPRAARVQPVAVLGAEGSRHQRP